MKNLINCYDALFEKLYDRFIDTTDTNNLLKEITAESLESFLRRAAKGFYLLGKQQATPIIWYLEANHNEKTAQDSTKHNQPTQ